MLSTSAVLQYPKLKTHQGAKKRWRSLPSGLFKRPKAGHQHLNTRKSSARKNALSQTAYSHGSQTATLNKLLPYGSRV
ncbi:Putative mitochondrial ribosomal protein new15 [Sparassis crispa]|uniref:50S ribosomal protein L35 n=1 Tax=Sparassis crispa TaxID=139825 RepID=A0A401GS91_9APHY|nr:Putative mitochondrial ribosomal protein new15 [Sparassis crispa]GBE85029.1 Putative mitochondrial ribosomal protein new15 [Sparassis crispa]